MKTLVTIFFLFLGIQYANSQCVFEGTNMDGTPYTVELELAPVDVIVTNCFEPGGFTYMTIIDFAVSYTGTPPSQLFTFQGNLNCGGTNSFFELPNQGIDSMGLTTAANASTNSSNNGPCADASPETLMCETAIVTIQGPGIPFMNVDCPLTLITPVKLSSFTVETNIKNQVEIEWVTESEVENDFFTLEYSIDGSQWKELAIVKGQGNSSLPTTYSYVDVLPEANHVFYRLMQTDFDGARTFSDIEDATIEKLSNDIIAYPNPVVDVVTLQSRIPLTVYQITDLQGQQLPIFINAVNDREIQLDLSMFVPGLYIVHTDEGPTKIFKQ